VRPTLHLVGCQNPPRAATPSLRRHPNLRRHTCATTLTCATHRRRRRRSPRSFIPTPPPVCVRLRPAHIFRPVVACPSLTRLCGPRAYLLYTV